MHRLFCAFAIPLTLLAGRTDASPASAASPPSATARDYSIQPVRPARIGSRFRVTATGTKGVRLSYTVNGVENRGDQTAFKVEVKAVGEVLEVDAAGRPTRVRYSVEKCLRTDEGPGVEVVAKGAAVVARIAEGETVFELDGGTLGMAARDALALVLSLGEEKSQEALFAPPAWPPSPASSDPPSDRRRPGDSWPVDPQAARESLTSGSLEIDPASIAGTATLVGVRSARGSEVLELVVEVAARRLAMPTEGLPPGMSFKEGTVRYRLTGLFPADPAYRPLSRKKQLEASFVLEGKVGPQEMLVRAEGMETTVTDRQETPLP